MLSFHSKTYRNTLLVQVVLERRYHNGARVEYAGGERSIHVGIDERRTKMIGYSRAARSNQRYATDRASGGLHDRER